MIVKNEQLEQVLRHINDGQLGQALAGLENYLLAYSHPKEQEALARIREDYLLMADYWQRGYKDAQRKEVYRRLLQRLYALTKGMAVSYAIRNMSFVLATYKRARAIRKNWALESVQHDLETFVADQALLELKTDGVRSDEERQIYERQQMLRRDLFDYIWTSRTWSENLAEAFVGLLTSPTIDTVDQQLMVSAMTLSLMNAFDYNKVHTLMTVYRQTPDEHVRQRALVGWVLAVDSQMLSVYPEMGEKLRELTADEDCRRELKELQMQLLYCLKADEDSRLIQQEMIPELMKNNDQFRITRNGIEEIEEDSMEDILHPEAAEQRMEQLEKTMRKMMDMQRAGSDIYFGGFAQMKRFPFFNDTCNWLMPFYPKHPGLGQALENVHQRKIILGLMGHSPFCDSDAYSFALGFQQAMGHLPKNIMEMLEHGELSLIGDVVDDATAAQPAYIRRRYLQDLYRFCRLFPSRSVFDHPFDETDGGRRLFFLLEPAFRNTVLADDVEYHMICATLLRRIEGVETDELLADSYRKVLEKDAYNERALRGLARLLFKQHDYQGTLDVYERLLELKPDRSNFLLNKAVCLGRLERYDEALKILYKMDYEQADDLNVKRVLAWTLVGSGKHEQAGKVYTQILEASQPEGDDLLNYGLCQWLSGDVVGAIGLFRHYAEACGDQGFDAETVFCREEAPLLEKNGISAVEIRMMIDAVRDVL